VQSSWKFGRFCKICIAVSKDLECYLRIGDDCMYCMVAFCIIPMAIKIRYVPTNTKNSGRKVVWCRN
jgi:hypothetical protein